MVGWTEKWAAQSKMHGLKTIDLNHSKGDSPELRRLAALRDKGIRLNAQKRREALRQRSTPKPLMRFGPRQGVTRFAMKPQKKKSSPLISKRALKSAALAAGGIAVGALADHYKHKIIRGGDAAFGRVLDRAQGRRPPSRPPRRHPFVVPTAPPPDDGFVYFPSPTRQSPERDYGGRQPNFNEEPITPGGGFGRIGQLIQADQEINPNFRGSPLASAPPLAWNAADDFDLRQAESARKREEKARRLAILKEERDARLAAQMANPRRSTRVTKPSGVIGQGSARGGTGKEAVG